MRISIATWTSNGSCSDALSLPISDWLFHSEGRASCDRAAILSVAIFPIQNYTSDTSWVFPSLKKIESEVTCGQVWWPILGICALHLTHPSAHTHSSEHTPGAVGSQCCGAQGAVGGSVPCSRVSPPSWYWRWKRALDIHSPHRQFLPDLRLKPTTFELQIWLSIH